MIAELAGKLGFNAKPRWSTLVTKSFRATAAACLSVAEGRLERFMNLLYWIHEGVVVDDVNTGFPPLRETPL